MHLTVGEIEYKNYLAQQHTVKNANLPHMEAVAGDLSGSLELSVRLWVELGTGFNCITEISVKEKSAFTSNEGMKIIVSAAASQVRGTLGRKTALHVNFLHKYYTYTHLHYNL